MNSASNHLHLATCKWNYKYPPDLIRLVLCKHALISNSISIHTKGSLHINTITNSNVVFSSTGRAKCSYIKVFASLCCCLVRVPCSHESSIFWPRKIVQWSYLPNQILNAFLVVRLIILNVSFWHRQKQWPIRGRHRHYGSCSSVVKNFYHRNEFSPWEHCLPK
jgi:hypothetical protein